MIENHQPLACLPYITMDDVDAVDMGPLRFCCGAACQEQIPKKLLGALGSDVNGITLISIDRSVPKELHQDVLGDAVCLLFFLYNYRTLLRKGEAPRLDLFTSIIPIHDQESRDYSKVNYDAASSKVVIREFEKTLAEGLGKALTDAYALRELSEAQSERAMRVIRSVRFFVERFYPQLNDLTWHGAIDQSSLWESEAAVYLALSWESLLNIDRRHPEADLKHKLRPMLQLKYAAPVEVLWKWVDGFFEIRAKVVHGQQMGTGLFTANPTMSLSHVFLGFKIFVYCIHDQLYKMGYLNATEDCGPDQPLDYPGIGCREVLVFFWSEEALLFRIRKALKSLQKTPGHEELRGDIKLLTQVYVYLAQNYLFGKPDHIEIHKDQQDSIEETVYKVLHVAELPNQVTEADDFSRAAKELMDPDFIPSLRRRLYPF